jgi:hypothetical protein
MTEVAERYPVAWNAAIAVLAKMIDFWPDIKGEPLEWLREYDQIQGDENIFIIRCTFWANRNPHDKLDLDVQMSLHRSGAPLVWMILVRYPHSDRIDRWDFDNEGKNPVRVK